jgi:hypothetical protein
MGAGTGFANGMQNLTSLYLEKRRLDNQQKYYDLIGNLTPQRNDYDAEFERGRQGLSPAYTEEQEAAQAAATRPEIPSSTPVETPGPLGVPQTQFPVGKAVQPMPQAPRAGGAMDLIPSMRRPSITPRIGRRRY